MHKFNMLFTLCEIDSEEESEKHLLNCSKIVEKLGHNIDFKNACYDNIFSANIEDQVKITKVFDKVFKTRNILLSQKSTPV